MYIYNKISQNDLPNNIHTIKYSVLNKNKMFTKNFKNLKHIIYYNNDKLLKEDKFPENLETLSFSYYYDVGNSIISNNKNKKMNEMSLPKNLKYLKLPDKFNKYINKNFLPNSLIYLHFNDYFDKKIKEDTLPDLVMHLMLKLKKNVYQNFCSF